MPLENRIEEAFQNIVHAPTLDRPEDNTEDLLAECKNLVTFGREWLDEDIEAIVEVNTELPGQEIQIVFSENLTPERRVSATLVALLRARTRVRRDGLVNFVGIVFPNNGLPKKIKDSSTPANQFIQRGLIQAHHHKMIISPY